MYVKVSKSQNLILGNIPPYEARTEFYLIFSLFFGQWNFKKIYKTLMYITWIVVAGMWYFLCIVRQLFKGDNYSREETINH